MTSKSSKSKQEHAPHEPSAFRKLDQGLTGDTIGRIESEKKAFKSKYDQQIQQMRQSSTAGGKRGPRSSNFLNANVDSLKASELAIENDRLQTTILLLNQKLNDHCDHEQQIDILKEKNVQQEEEINNQQAALLNKDQIINSLNSKIRLLNDELAKTTKAKEVHKHDNCDLNDKAAGLEEELYDARWQLQLAQSKIAELMEYIENFRYKVYIGRKNDNIDHALGNFINKFPEKNRMKIMFIRQSEGVYQFGSKKVYMKIEQGNKIQVRVGGGYMHIDEFVQQYTPLEVEKVERKDVVGRFHTKVQMQRIANASQTAVESSPIRTSQKLRSPDRRMMRSFTSIEGKTNTFKNFSPRKQSPQKKGKGWKDGLRN